MKREIIAWENFNSAVFHQWAKDWLLLCAGDYSKGEYNMMTVGWGSFGVIWGKPFAMILVRPQRFTAPLLEKYPTFTLSAFPETCREALNFCGAKSGRDYADKAKAAGLTAVPSLAAGAPGFEEAELVIECRKTYGSSLKPECFLPRENAEKLYPNGDLHLMYFGEIVSISGTEKFLCKGN